MDLKPLATPYLEASHLLSSWPVMVFFRGTKDSVAAASSSSSPPPSSSYGGLEQKMFHGGGDAAIRVAVTQVWHKPQEKPDCKSGKEEGGGLAHN